jgi:hypothetical protein
MSGDIYVDGAGLIASRLAPTGSGVLVGIVQNAGIPKGVVQNKTGPMPSLSVQRADLKTLFAQKTLA